MTRLRLLGAIVLAGALLAPAAPAQAALETLVQDDAALLYSPPEDVRPAMEKLRSLGVDRVRLTANWSVLAPDPDAGTKPGGFDARDPAAYPQARWTGLDNAVRLAQATGLKVMMDIGFWAPRWATTDKPGPRARTNVDAKAFADFAVAVARRYNGTSGAVTSVFEPRPALPSVDQFVLWNEPNHPSLLLPQWKGRGRRARPASPALYARMVRAAYPAAKAVHPGAAFLLGNTSSDGGRPPNGAVAPLRFIRDMTCVGPRLRPLRRAGCRRYKRLPGDGWAHHPYPRQLRPDNPGPANRPDNVRTARLGRLSTLLRRLARRGRVDKRLRRIHLTEFGYETSRIRGRPLLSQGTQARWLTWAEYLSSRVPGVVTFAQFLLRDLAPGPVRVSTSKNRGFGQYYSGLQTTTGKDKLAAKSFTAGLFAQRLARRRKVLLWGRLRLGAGKVAIKVERRGRRSSKWRKLKSFTVDGQGAFKLRTHYVGGRLYRLRWPRADGSTAAGLAVRPVNKARR